MRYLRPILFTTVFLSLAAPGHAALIALSDSHHGLESITLDTATGMEWLDLTKSTNRSINDLLGIDGSNEFQSGGDFEGFRFATADEVRTLVIDAGVHNIDGHDLSGYDEVAQLMKFIGVTDVISEPLANGIEVLSWGFTSTPSFDPFATGGVQSPLLQLHEPGLNVPTTFGWASFYNFSYDSEHGGAGIGSWLVRDTTTVPEPSTLFLLTTGLAATLVARKRKAEKPQDSAGPMNLSA